MSEIFRIIGKNDIHLDAGPTGNYLFSQGRPPRKLSTILTRQEVLSVLPQLPLGARPLALKHGLSVITMELNIWGVSGADMERKEHALIETLVETDLFFGNGGTMGTRAELQVRSPEASEVSFKTVFYGVVDELDARDVLGAVIKQHSLEGLRLTLYCESHWRPGTFNYLFNGGFEFWDRVQYGGTGVDTEPDGWLDYENFTGAGALTNNREAVTIHSGTYSLKINLAAVNNGGYKGVYQNILPYMNPNAQYTLVFWLKNDAVPGGNGRVRIVSRGDVSGWNLLYSSAAANATWTRYSFLLTPNLADTWFRIYVYGLSLAAAYSHTMYGDGMMVVRGTVLPGDFIEWHPNPGVRIGPNLPSNAGFEEWHAGMVDSQPDSWSDLESLTAGTGTNNRESTSVLQACYALRIDVNGINNGNYKGVFQSILARVTAGTTYVLIGWVKNAAIVNGGVRLQVIGDALGTISALASGAANDKYTRYAVAFTPSGADTWLQVRAHILATADGCTGTVYFDKLMVIKASPNNGHSFVPEEWTGCGWLFNHYDSTAGHVNYLCITDLRGDVDARPELRVEFEQVADETLAMRLFTARRTRETICKFMWWLEAESGAGWGVGNEAACSQGGFRTSPAGDGDHVWTVGATYGNLPSFRGRYRVYGKLRTDHVNIRVRLKYRFSGSKTYDYIGSWKALDVTGKWKLEYLGNLYFNLPLPVGIAFDELRIALESSGSTAMVQIDCDYLWLVPDDEATLELGRTAVPFLGVSNEWYYNLLGDFIPFACDRDSTGDLHMPYGPKGQLTLRPNVANRLYFVCTSFDDPDEIVEVHGAATSLMLLVTLSYLPQFVSPLE